MPLAAAADGSWLRSPPGRASDEELPSLCRRGRDPSQPQSRALSSPLSLPHTDASSYTTLYALPFFPQNKVGGACRAAATRGQQQPCHAPPPPPPPAPTAAGGGRRRGGMGGSRPPAARTGNEGPIRGGLSPSPPTPGSGAVTLCCPLSWRGGGMGSGAPAPRRSTGLTEAEGKECGRACHREIK